MSASGANPSTSSQDAQPTHEGTTGVNDVSGSSMFSPSSVLEELLRDDPEPEIDDDRTTIYSYYSTVSTNYTMSNLEGPGRLLGNLYSKAGSLLERRLAQRAQQRAHRSALEAYSRALALLQERGTIGSQITSTDWRKNEKGCEALLICAQYVFLSFVMRRGYMTSAFVKIG